MRNVSNPASCRNNATAVVAHRCVAVRQLGQLVQQLRPERLLQADKLRGHALERVGDAVHTPCEVVVLVRLPRVQPHVEAHDCERVRSRLCLLQCRQLCQLRCVVLDGVPWVLT